MTPVELIDARSGGIQDLPLPEEIRGRQLTKALFEDTTLYLIFTDEVLRIRTDVTGVACRFTLGTGRFTDEGLPETIIPELTGRTITALTATPDRLLIEFEGRGLMLCGEGIGLWTEREEILH